MPIEPKYTYDFATNNVSIDILMDNLSNINIGYNYDMEYATDLQEFRQRVIHCLITDKGEIPHRADFGCGIMSLQNAPENSSMFSTYAALIRQQLTNAIYFPETESVDSVSFGRDSTDRAVIVGVKITTKQYDTLIQVNVGV